jgi:hypothetical protein
MVLVGMARELVLIITAGKYFTLKEGLQIFHSFTLKEGWQSECKTLISYGRTHVWLGWQKLTLTPNSINFEANSSFSEAVLIFKVIANYDFVACIMEDTIRRQEVEKRQGSSVIREAGHW